MRSLAAAALATLVFAPLNGAATPTPRPEALSWGSGPEIVFSAAGRGIFLLDPFTRTTRLLTAKGAGEWGPGSWSPDGRMLVFVAHFRLFTVRADGSGLRAVGPGVNPVWSRDGGRLAFYRPGLGLFVENADGSGAHEVARSRYTAVVGTPAWSPDDARLAYVACRASFGTPPCEHQYGFDLYTIGTNGRHRRRITPRSGLPLCFDWSRRGLLAYETESGITIASPHRRRTVNRAGCPVWSPDGRTLALGSGGFGPTLLDGQGRVVRRLHVTRRRLFAQGEVAWSPDGRQLAFLHGRFLDAVGVDGRGARQLLP